MSIEKFDGTLFHYSKLLPTMEELAALSKSSQEEAIKKLEKGQPQDTDPSKPHYFAPYDDQGNKRTINNAVDCGWSAID